jgi:CRISPR-associated protein Csh2
LLEAIWDGTKNLISGSKFGQVPRLLLQVVYKEGLNFHIGELDRLISMRSDKVDESIRDITDLKIDITALVKRLEENMAKIECIRFKVDERISFVKDDKNIDIRQALINLPVKELVF